MVRIRSEHAIGYLKGRFQSLKNLRIAINSAKAHKFATYWITSCITIHAWAMQREQEERERDGNDHESAVFEDPFIAEGLDSSDSEYDGNVGPGVVHHDRQSRTCLDAAKSSGSSLSVAYFVTSLADMIGRGPGDEKRWESTWMNN